MLFLSPSTPVSIATLLPQMTDLEYLTRRSNPPYTMAQASSYDRASNPGPHQNWFANGDAGQFVRHEVNDGRKEDVMADLKGPGAVVRMWSANPQGTIRLYFDDEKVPRIVAPMDDFLTGRVAPFLDPFGYDASSGHDLYFPFPYTKHLKITAEGTRGLYYHVGFRTYPAGTAVTTYSADQAAACSGDIKTASDKFGAGVPDNAAVASDDQGKVEMVPAGGSVSISSTSGSGEIFSLQFKLIRYDSKLDWDDPANPHNLMRHLILKGFFDGEQTINVPVSDFFCATPDPTNLKTLAFVDAANGRLTCYFPMPYRKTATITISNENPTEVGCDLQVGTRARKWDRNSYLFHAQWSGDGGPSQPPKDMNLLTTSGEGRWVGCNLTVGNPTDAWWGEGDEKAYVDGESFPSTWGTGTEDFFGYAWGSSKPYQRQYHAQPYVQGPGSFGYSQECRFQIFDNIPYTKSLRFDLEKWHWANVVMNYVYTAYWYQKPGGTGPKPIDPSFLTLAEIKPPPPVKGAIEGENLKVLQMTGGHEENQGGFFGLSNGYQLWWQDAAVGDKLVLQVPVATAGRYKVLARMCHAEDYGIHTLTLNGAPAGKFDFYHDGVEWDMQDLGEFDLPAGNVNLEVDCQGHNAKALPRNMFGLDYLRLQPVTGR